MLQGSNRVRARRSAVDRFLRKEEASGSNPDESTSLVLATLELVQWTRLTPTRSLRSLAGVPTSPSERLGAHIPINLLRIATVFDTKRWNLRSLPY